MPGAGDLRDRITFSKRATTADQYGNPVSGDFADQFTRWAEIKPMRGGEDVLAARLQGTQPVMIRVRFDSQTKNITPDWRAVDARSGAVYAIKTAVDMDRRRLWIEILAEAGEAA